MPSPPIVQCMYSSLPNPSCTSIPARRCIPFLPTMQTVRPLPVTCHPNDSMSRGWKPENAGRSLWLILMKKSKYLCKPIAMNDEKKCYLELPVLIDRLDGPVELLTERLGEELLDRELELLRKYDGETRVDVILRASAMASYDIYKFRDLRSWTCREQPPCSRPCPGD
jgi:hypothetical protein